MLSGVETATALAYNQCSKFMEGECIGDMGVCYII